LQSIAVGLFFAMVVLHKSPSIVEKIAVHVNTIALHINSFFGSILRLLHKAGHVIYLGHRLPAPRHRLG
jgi:hypothetical protein